MLTHYDSVATLTLTGKSWSKTFTQNYSRVGLIILTKAGGVSTTPHLAGEIQTMHALVQGKNVLVTMPFAGTFHVQIYTTGGRKIMEKQAYGPGKSEVTLTNVPAGEYVLKCENPANSFKSLVVIEK
jgi:hypothetical protein